jgi:hypothetical protein
MIDDSANGRGLNAFVEQQQTEGIQQDDGDGNHQQAETSARAV